MRSLKFLLVAVAASLAAALPGAASAQTAGEYVSLGDSFVAGPLIPAQLPPFGCLKSSNNYPHLAAGPLGLNIPLKDPSCSGAETEDMENPQGVTPGPNPPQFDSLSANTTMVSLGIGGNDIGFSSIAQNCLSFQSPEGQPCKDRYTATGTDEISERIAATRPLVQKVYEGIRREAPNVQKILFVNYAAILPHEGTGCWPQIPVAKGDVVWLREKHEELNAMLEEVSVANGAEVVDWYEASRGHDACQLPVVKWVEGVVPVNAAAPLHPNLQGMKAAADLLVAAVRTP